MGAHAMTRQDAGAAVAKLALGLQPDAAGTLRLLERILNDS